MEIPIGTTVGGYLLKRRLGAGSMGAVYQARHRSLPRDVALKVLHPVFATVPEFRQRFEREADALCQLEHPNVVDVLDRGQDGDLLWIAMRFVDGSDLHTALRERGPFTADRAVDVVAAIGSALDHAHARGLLHRDVKPANVLLRRTDGGEQAVLTDFGIAKDVSAAPLTREGQPPATVAYASPEQLAGERLDGRADVYSLGAVLFELLAGRRAFPLEDPTALYASVVAGPVPDLRSIRPDVPAALAEVVTRSLQKDPQDRFATCAQLVDAARAALTPRPAAPPTTIGAAHDPPPPPPREQPAPPQPAPPHTAPSQPAHPAPAHPAPSPAVEPPTRSQTAPAGRPPRPRRWPLVLALALALVAVGAAVVGVLLSTGGDDPGAGEAPSTSAVPSGSGPVSSAGSSLAVGDCLDAGGAATACDGPHASEVYSTSACDDEQLLDYLGGRVGSDVLRSDLVRGERPIDAGTACTVGRRGEEMAEPNAGVLGDDAGDVWRRCLDARSDEVPCSDEHTAEVVFVRTEGTEPLNCTGRATEYLGTPFDRHSDDLEVVESGSACLVAVRGNNVLTASVRDLRSTALPLEAAG